MFENLTTEQLREELRAFNRAEQAQAEPALPLPPATPPGLTPAQQEALFDNWVADIDKRKPQTWTPAERRAYEFAAARALRTMQR